MAKKSRDYWREREEEARRHTIQDEETYNREIKRIYQTMYDNMDREINGFFTKYAGREGITIAEAKQRVSKLDMDPYRRKAKRYVANKDFSKQANDEMRLYNLTMKINRLELLKANLGLEMVNSYQDLEDYMGRKLNETTLKELERQAGILGNTVGDNKKLARQIVNGSFHHAKWSDRIWSNQQTLKMKIYDNLQTGLIQGRNPRVLARDIQKSMGASQYDAERLMRTEMCRVQTDAQMESMAANGFDMYEFIAEHGPRTCEQCLAMDGKHFKIKAAMPGENAPPLHPNCRCSTAAWMDDKAYEEWLDSGAAADGVSFKDFSANYKATGETGPGFEEWRTKNQVNKNKSSMKMNLQFFGYSDKRNVIANIKSGKIDNNKFNNCYNYFKKKFKNGVQTPIEVVFDKTDAFYHIVNRHQEMMSVKNIDKIVDTLMRPQAVYESMDRFGNIGKAYIQNAKSPLLVIVRNGIITAYKPKKKYLAKVRRGNKIW